MSVTAALPGGELAEIPAKVCRIPMEGLRLQPMIIYGGDLQAIGPTGSGLMQGNYQVRGEASKRALGGRAVMIDVGANMGMTSIAYALAHPSITVHAYELNPGTFAFLQRNIAANGLIGRVIPHNIGLGRGTVRISHCAMTARFGNQMLASKKYQIRLKCRSAGCKHLHTHLKNCTDSDPRQYDMPTTTFDAALNTAGGSAGVLKVDCEGCEWDILDDIVTAKRMQRIGRAVGDCHHVGREIVSAKRVSLCQRVLERSHSPR